MREKKGEKRFQLLILLLCNNNSRSSSNIPFLVCFFCYLCLQQLPRKLKKTAIWPSQQTAIKIIKVQKNIYFSRLHTHSLKFSGKSVRKLVKKFKWKKKRQRDKSIHYKHFRSAYIINIVDYHFVMMQQIISLEVIKKGTHFPCFKVTLIKSETVEEEDGCDNCTHT